MGAPRPGRGGREGTPRGAPRVVRIYSENNDFQYLDALRRKREKRHRARELFVEGVRPINQMLANGWPVVAFAYAPERPLSGWAREILAGSTAGTHLEMPPALVAKLSAKTETSELIAVAAMPDDDLERIPITDDLLVVAFDRPASPGNLGTTIRACDALGGTGLIVTGHATDLYDPETIAATTGSFFAVPSVRLTSSAELVPWLRATGRRLPDLQVVGMSEDGEAALGEVDFTPPTVLAIGNETWGLSAHYRELCDVVARIPIRGAATSLNVASAAAITLYEADRQRRAAGAPRRRRRA